MMTLKILAVTDIHGNKICIKNILKKLKREEDRGKPVDYIVCCGDFTVFQHSMLTVLDWLNKLPKKVILIHGNHENAEQVRKACRQRKNIIYIHRKALRVQKDYVFLGYGGGGFALTDERFVAWSSNMMKKMKKEDRIILMTHGPAYGTNLDLVSEDHHCGNKDYTFFIKKYQPTLYLSGHIHECFGHSEKIKKSVLLNPGPFGIVVDIK